MSRGNYVQYNPLQTPYPNSPYPVPVPAPYPYGSPFPISFPPPIPYRGDGFDFEFPREEEHPLTPEEDLRSFDSPFERDVPSFDDHSLPIAELRLCFSPFLYEYPLFNNQSPL